MALGTSISSCYRVGDKRCNAEGMHGRHNSSQACSESRRSQFVYLLKHQSQVQAMLKKKKKVSRMFLTQRAKAEGKLMGTNLRVHILKTGRYVVKH